MAEEKEESEIPEKFKNLVDTISQMSVLDLSELVKVLEKRFGVSAAPTVIASAGVSASLGGGEAAEEKTSFTVELTSAGGQKIQVIKVVREVTGKGLKEAKDLVDAAPKAVKENVRKDEAEEIKKKIEEAGGTAMLK